MTKEVRSAEDWERFLLFGEKLPELKIIEVKQPDYADHRHAELISLIGRKIEVK